jgi:hypothetical protein
MAGIVFSSQASVWRHLKGSSSLRQWFAGVEDRGEEVSEADGGGCLARGTGWCASLWRVLHTRRGGSPSCTANFSPYSCLCPFLASHQHDQRPRLCHLTHVCIREWLYGASLTITAEVKTTNAHANVSDQLVQPCSLEVMDAECQAVTCITSFKADKLCTSSASLRDACISCAVL